MFNSNFLDKTNCLQDQFASFVELIKKTRTLCHLTDQDEVTLSMDESLEIIGLNSVEQLDSWLLEHPELCGFIHNGNVIISRCNF
jgi:hypothetical protein